MNPKVDKHPTDEGLNAGIAAKGSGKEVERKGPNRAERRRQQRGGKFSAYEIKRRSEQLRR